MKNVTSTKGSIMFYLIPSVISLGFFISYHFISMKLFQYIGIYFIAPIFFNYNHITCVSFNKEEY